MKVNLILNHIIKILFVSLLCIMLFIGSIFVIPPKFAFADSEFSAYILGSGYTGSVPTSTDPTDFTYSYQQYSSSKVYYNNIYLDSSNSFDEPVYAFLYVNNNGSTPAYKLCVVAERRLTSPEVLSVSYSAGFNQNLSIGANTSSSSNNLSLDSESGLYYKAGDNYVYTSNILDNTLPVYDTRALGLSAIKDAIDNNLPTGGAGGNPNPIEPKQAIITIEPGYVAYIGVTGGNAIFTATFNKKQPSGSITSNIRYGFSSSRPPENSTITMDSSVGSMIPFVADRPFDIWGKSYNGRYGMADLSASYLIVYVPLTDPDGNTNATVKVALSEYLNSVQFPLSASMVGGDIVSTGNSDEFYISDSSMLNDDFRPEYVYSNGGTTSTAITIPVGGNNLPPTTGGGSLIEQFTTLLSDLINRIESLLIAPVEYIKWIISSSSNFMAWLSAIWTWLPEPVYTTIVSVLLILVVVGALKLLWR